MTNEEMHQEIDLIPGEDGWWHSSTGEMYHALADDMTLCGVDRAKTVNILECAFGAAAEEFGR